MIRRILGARSAATGARHDRTMADRKEHQPGTHAPITGHFEELNVFGSPTGKVEYVQEGERLPPAPQGFSWRHINDKDC
jgi:hypothetical protein